MWKFFENCLHFVLNSMEFVLSKWPINQIFLNFQIIVKLLLVIESLKIIKLLVFITFIQVIYLQRF